MHYIFQGQKVVKHHKKQLQESKVGKLLHFSYIYEMMHMLLHIHSEILVSFSYIVDVTLICALFSFIYTGLNLTFDFLALTLRA